VTDRPAPSAAARTPALPATVLGEGPPIVFCHGFALTVRTYRPVLELLADHGTTVVAPDLFAGTGKWTYHGMLDGIEALLEERAIERYTLIAHSFGGGLALGLAARHPERIAEMVFSDTIGVSGSWRMAWSALTGLPSYYRLATARAAADFVGSWLHRPRRLADAAWWAFRSEKTGEIRAVRSAGIDCFVLWAERDTLLDRRDGARFARYLNAPFVVAEDGREHGTIDHDWVFQHPALFGEVVEGLGLHAFDRANGDRPTASSTRRTANGASDRRRANATR
jgi:pimeloyl-ACP methyl ester carboxylesterase